MSLNVIGHLLIFFYYSFPSFSPSSLLISWSSYSLDIVLLFFLFSSFLVFLIHHFILSTSHPFVFILLRSLMIITIITFYFSFPSSLLSSLSSHVCFPTSLSFSVSCLYLVLFSSSALETCVLLGTRNDHQSNYCHTRVLQGGRAPRSYSVSSLPPAFTLISCFVHSSTLKLEENIPPKRRLSSNGLYVLISQKIERFITTGVRTSNPN
jgi:hypothetical protein